MVSDNAPAVVNLDAVMNFISVIGVYALGRKRNGVFVSVRRRAYSVGFYDVQTERIRRHLLGFSVFQKHKNVARHEPRFHNKLFETVKIVQSERVALCTFRPHTKFRLRAPLPLLRRFLRKTENGTVGRAAHMKSRSDDLCSVRVYRRCRDRRRHIKHTPALAQCQIIFVDILRRRGAFRIEAFKRAFYVTCACVAVAARVKFVFFALTHLIYQSLGTMPKAFRGLPPFIIASYSARLFTASSSSFDSLSISKRVRLLLSIV